LDASLDASLSQSTNNRLYALVFRGSSWNLSVGKTLSRQAEKQFSHIAADVASFFLAVASATLPYGPSAGSAGGL
jgi:hypothetical protein